MNIYICVVFLHVGKDCFVRTVNTIADSKEQAKQDGLTFAKHRFEEFNDAEKVDCDAFLLDTEKLRNALKQIDQATDLGVFDADINF